MGSRSSGRLLVVGALVSAPTTADAQTTRLVEPSIMTADEIEGDPSLSRQVIYRPADSGVVARWPVRHTARQSLGDWRSKEGLGGIVLPPGVQEEVLNGLEAWAVEAFGGLDAALETEDAYVLEGVRLLKKV